MGYSPHRHSKPVPFKFYGRKPPLPSYNFLGYMRGVFTP